MKSSFRIFSISGIEIRIHFTLFIILIVLSYILYINPFPFGFGDVEYSQSIRILLSIFSSIGLFVAVLVHELSHSLLSKRSGIKVKGILLFIFGGVSLLEKFPKEPEKEILIALAGPLTSFGIAGGAYMISLTGVPAVSEFFKVFFFFNLVLGLFNLIPAFPLDGGRILRGFIARKTDFVRATQIAAGVGKSFAIFMGIFGLLAFSPWLILIALFIYMGANEEERMAVVEGILVGSRVSDVMTPNPVTVSSDSLVKEVLDLMFKTKHLGYPVVEEEKVIGIVTLQDVARVPPDTPVSELMTRDVVTILPEMSTFDAFKLMNERNIGRLPVVDKNGNLVGIVSRTDLMRVLEVVGAIRGGK
ncbi:MAG TPA: CBS domain-containing protein [Archaeoglobaceae archaeon]|nr:CBS domain-containing protein [Archaeoglobaceae archaeon]